MSKVILLLANNQSPFAPPYWEHLLARLPESLRSPILSFHRWQDRQASLLARLMLARQFGTASLLLIQKDEFGRPGLPGVEFNISHSHEVVLLAVADERVGVDVEKIRPIDPGDYQMALNPRERQHLERCTAPAAAFFAIWTAKEAAMKADGRGMSIPLENVVLQPGVASIEGTEWRLTAVPLGEAYACHVALRGTKDTTPADIVTSSFDPLMDVL